VPATYNLASLTYASGKLYVLSYDGVLRAFDGATGAQIWSATLGFGEFDAPPNAVGGIVYAAGSFGISAVNAANGAPVWQLPVGTMAFDSPTVAADGVYTTSQCWDNKFDPLSGVIIWQISHGCSGGTAWTSVYSNGLLYKNNIDPAKTYSVLDAQTATNLLSYPSALLPAVNGGLGVFIDGQSVLRVVDLLTGNTRWTNSSISNLLVDPLLVDNMVIAATVFGDVYAFDSATGTLLWTGAAGAQIDPAGWNAERALPGMGIGNGWLIVPADHSLRAWKLVP
jgi:outer membrane protein assembly factor BamB